MKTSILLVEDDADLGFMLQHYMELCDFEVCWLQDPRGAFDSDWTYDLAVLDVMMPYIDGFTLAKKIWEIAPDFPLLFLTAKNQKIDRMMGLQMGADDYIQKPCDPDELVLRIRNILKRKAVHPAAPVVAIGSYLLDRSKHILIHASQSFRLTEKEMQLLNYLLKYNHQVLSRQQILSELWGTNDFFTGRSMDVFITRLRKYLKYDSSLQIQSLRGIGFQVDL